MKEIYINPHKEDACIISKLNSNWEVMCQPIC